MFQFFVPQTKVQKDRAIMRDTDARVAKYSRRGLVLNFIVFALCLYFGNFQEQEHDTSVVLITGLLLVTLWRAYFLFRFDTLYARGPARWRNQYFFASCIGAAWWSVILVTLTWHLGMQNETLVMWLYSVVFYSSVANVFAPYRRFLVIYLGIGQVPAAITAMTLGDVDGMLYGAIMLMFYYMLSHQGKVTCHTYWERLEANLSLRERAYGLEKERATSQAQMELKNEFLVNLGQEFRSSISDVLTTLSRVDENQLSDHHRELLTMATKAAGRQIDLVNNVVDFSKITTHSLVLDQTEFDLRRVLEKFVQDYSLDAHQQGVELFYLFDSSMPSRLRGDVSRLNQILSTLLSYALKAPGLEQIFIEARFKQEQDDNGILQITISDDQHSPKEKDQGAETHMQGIGLSICKGLAECMGGNLHIREGKNRSHRIFVDVALGVVSHEETRLGYEQKLRDKNVLLIDLPEANGNALADEIKTWGMNTWMVSGQDAALNKLQELQKNQRIDLVLIYTRLSNMNGLAISREIAARPGLADIPQILAMSSIQSDTAEMRLHLRSHPQISIIDKPLMRRRLYEMIVQKLIYPDAEPTVDTQDNASLAKIQSPKILLVQDHRVEQMVMSAMLKKLGCQVHIVPHAAEAEAIVTSERFDAILMDYDMREQESLLATEHIREQERQNLSRHIPIIAVTASYAEGDQSACIAAGMDDALAKPIRLEDLEAKLRRWIQND
jgi:two-component system, sensor histidine kinase RetS